MRGLAAIPKREVEAFRAMDKPPLQSRHVLLAACVILGLEPPKPPVIDSEPLGFGADAERPILVVRNEQVD